MSKRKNPYGQMNKLDQNSLQTVAQKDADSYAKSLHKKMKRGLTDLPIG